MSILRKKLETSKPQGQKAVKNDPNRVFARIPEIAQAHYEASQAASRYQQRHGPNLAQEAMEIAQAEKDSMYIEFQL